MTNFDLNHEDPSLLNLELPDPDEELCPGSKIVVEFPMFKALPQEIRLRIWTCSMGPGRIIPMNCESSTQGITLRPIRVPITLSINHESRDESLRYLERIYYAKGTRYTWFNPRIDTVYFECNLWLARRTLNMAFQEGTNTDSLRYVLFRDFWWGPNTSANLYENPQLPPGVFAQSPKDLVLRHFRKLERLTLVPAPICGVRLTNEQIKTM